ncbi:hypothetical protein FO519_000839 [Halicephalobus sp. NKZ332]|nr:hypothetical protein FO519_000839 [Halicephalobus sp. NKZ332]
MTTETLRTIVDGLNGPPFSCGFSLVTFDSIANEKLLQTLSDVLCWIEGMPEVDIRSESPDETTMRIMTALKVLKYPPPRDMDHIQKWRLDIVEGEKTAIYPILEWIFNNVDRLKERIYLARYLTKTEVPPEEVTPEIQKLQNVIAEKMEEFKHIHQRIVESRADYARAEDIRMDLKAMEEEKEQLQRKIEKVKRLTANRGDAQKYLELASKLRVEVEKNDQLSVERQAQRNALLHIEQRVQRLNRMKMELEREKESINPQNVIDKLKRDIDTNTYLVNEKLKREIETQKKNVININKILNMKTVTNSDIINLKKRIEVLNKEIIDITNQRDTKDEEHEDKLSIYRHQSMNIQRKKQAIAEQMQGARHELDHMEKMLNEKKRDLAARAGTDDIITAVQFKRYIAELRGKTTTYKRRKAEMEDLENELKILQRTVEILHGDWEDLKQGIEAEGRGVIESLNAQPPRPKTAKPTTTDVENLKSMAKELSDRVNTKRNVVQRLKEDIEQFSVEHRDVNEEYQTKKTAFSIMREEMESEQKHLEDTVQRLDTQFKKLSADKEKHSKELNDKEWIKEGIDDPQKARSILEQINQRNSVAIREIESLRTKLNELSNKASSGDQIAMWKSVIAAMEKKIELVNRRNANEGPIGDWY